jgi:cytochrome c-type biogenesis protein
MEFLRNLLENSQYSLVTALILGLMTAISPCPLATNISAIAYVSRDIDDRRRVFINGLVYTLGRSISYTGLALIIYLGASQTNISRILQGWGEKLLAPLLILIGLSMLDVIRIKFPGFQKLTENIGKDGKGGYISTLLLGVLFALTFCPYSGALYFAFLIPITITSPDGLYLPFVYGTATAIPVLIFAWLIAFTIGNVGKIYNQIKSFELWFRRIVAVIFIGIGIYYLIKLYSLS